MPTVLRFGNLRVMIYTNDHRPPHVHVVGPGIEAKIALGNETGAPSLITNEGLSRRNLETALEAIDRNSEALIQRWREIHGDA
jgi:hypothetical protein